MVAEELAISCFHASGEIWLELGEPVQLPARWDYAVYAPFPMEPSLQLLGTREQFEAKLQAIAAFASQRQIMSLVASQRAAGAQEYLQEVRWAPYTPERYRERFLLPGEVAPEAVQDGALPAGAAVGRAFARDCARTQELLARWPTRAWAPLVAAFHTSSTRPVLLLGEGSSRLFPAALALALAREAPLVRVEQLGGREAGQLALARYHVVLVSNSGRTRELAELKGPLAGVQGVLSVVGCGGGPVPRLAQEVRVLLEAPEEAVAATVSVFAQALCIAHALCEAAGLAVPWTALKQAVAAADAVRMPWLDGPVRRLWWSGPESGPAGELALKTMETVGCLGIHLPGSMALHGIEEVLEPGDLLVLLAPDVRDLPALRSRLLPTGAQLLVVGPGGDIPLADLGLWSGLPQLVAGWRLLAELAARQGRDPDRPRRARKVGNEAVPEAGASA